MNTPFIPPIFDWTLMRSFVAVMDEGSLQAAARKLRSSQPTISRHVAMLEQQLGSVLFERAGRQLLPTDLAHSIAEHARVMEASANAIGLALTAKSQATTGTVRISASQTSACYLLPPILKKLRESEPGIAIELVASNQISDLLRREADIAVRLVKPEQDSLISRCLGKVTIGIYAHKNYLQGRKIPQSLEELLHHDLIGFDNNGNIILGFKMFGVDIDKNAFQVRTDDHIALLHAVKASMGIGFTATYVGRSDPDLQRLLPDLPITPMPVWLTVHREIRNNPRIRRVYDFLAETIATALREDE
jgi:DNA-binding transcriptional LysR family regulator